MDLKTINELATEVHKNAVAKGFWENNPSDDHCLCLVISELMEAVEADRKGRHARVKLFSEDIESFSNAWQEDSIRFNIAFMQSFEEYIKDSISDEISDAFIRLLDLTGAHGYIFDEEFLINASIEKRTFTENIYVIVQSITKEKYSIKGRVLLSAQIIIKLAETLGFDLEWHVRQKMRYNSLREYKHGKAY